MRPVLAVEHLSKAYQLGQIGTGTLTNDLRVWWAKRTGQPNPLLRIGDADHGNRAEETIWALKDVSFTVEQGEVLGIIGRNGAGKSTLLKVLSRITAPTSGRVRVKGRVASLLEVGTGFHPELTGRENLYLNGAILGMRRREIDGKLDEIVAFAEIEKFIDTPVKRYSSGMYVRLAFAVAAHLEPEILLVDEVLAVGDAAFQKKCLGKMGDIAQDGRTVLFVSHNMAAIGQLCSLGIVLCAGQARGTARVKEVINAYIIDNGGLASSISLASRRDRVGGSRLRFTKITLLNGTGEAVDSIASGEAAQFVIQYEAATDEPLRNVSVSLRVDDNLGQYLFTLASEFTNEDFVSLPPRGTLICRVPALPLVAGQYSVFLWSAVNGDLGDKVEDTMRFYVSEADVYDSGRFPVKRKHGSFLMRYTWGIADH